MRSLKEVVKSTLARSDFLIEVIKSHREDAIRTQEQSINFNYVHDQVNKPLANFESFLTGILPQFTIIINA